MKQNGIEKLQASIDSLIAMAKQSPNRLDMLGELVCDLLEKEGVSRSGIKQNADIEGIARKKEWDVVYWRVAGSRPALRAAHEPAPSFCKFC